MNKSTPPTVSEQTASLSEQTPGPAHPAGLALLLASLVSMTTFLIIAQRSEPETHRPEPLSVDASPVAVSVVERDVKRAKFYDAEVEPRIAETDQLNRESAIRCLIRLRQVFYRYRRGVDPFVEDLTSISTRMGIVRRMPGNWWSGDDRIENYVRGKFETHLFSEEQLFEDVSSVLESFRQEVDANQKRMLISVRASLDLADLPEVQVEQYEPFFQAVAEQLRGYSSDQGTTSVYNALTVLIISEAGSYAAVTVVAGLLARFGSAAAVTAAAGVGATAGATATGAGGGSLVGPVGTVVGLGVGLAVGLVIDWWMTDRFEEEMSEQMTLYLRSLENTILHGEASETSQSSLGSDSALASSGLVRALPDLCDSLASAYRERFYQQIVSPQSDAVASTSVQASPNVVLLAD